MRPRLITIAISHYCEKARWALDRSGIAYDEIDHVPVLHAVALRGALTPILHDGDRTIRDSTEILLALEDRIPDPLRLHPRDRPEREAALALEHRFDEELGPIARRIAWFHMLGAPSLFASTIVARGRPWERWLARRAPGTVAATLRRAFKLRPDSIARAEAELERFLDEISSAIRPGRWLLGDRFSVADLTLAALFAPLLAPPEHPFPYVPASLLSEAYRSYHARICATRAGELALRAYREERARRP